MLIKNAKDLNVYKIAFDLSIQIHELSLEFPKLERFEIASQIRRANKSICSNLAEGFAKQSISVAEFARFLSFAIGSAKEVQVWLDYSFELGYIKKDAYDKLLKEYDSVFAMLMSLRSKL